MSLLFRKDVLLRAISLCAVILGASSSSAIEVDLPPTAAEAASLSRGDDELWFVSSRHARYETDGPIDLHVWKYDGVGNWTSSSLDALAVADPSLPFCFHIHGNRVSYGQSNYGGWRFYTTLTDGCAERKPLRFVIFSWPSDRICGSQRDDVRTKAVVAERHAYFLAYVVRRLPVESRISMIGYSFGARVIGGALHELGGGTLRGRSLGEEAPADEHRVRAVFLAAALDSGSFLPGCTFDDAPSQIDRLLICRNSADRVLKWYPLLYQLMLRPGKGVQAMGYTGTAGSLPDLVDRVECVDVSFVVGNTHEWHGLEYLRGSLPSQMCEFVTFSETDESAAATVAD